MSDKVELRNRRILEAAAALAAEKGYSNITRDQVAEAAGVAAGSVNNAYGTISGLRDAVMRHAVETEHAGIVGQGLAAGHPAARAAPDALKAAALDQLATA